MINGSSSAIELTLAEEKNYPNPSKLSTEIKTAPFTKALIRIAIVAGVIIALAGIALMVTSGHTTLFFRLKIGMVVFG